VNIHIRAIIHQQIVTTVVLAIVMLMWQGADWAWSTIWGGAINVVASLGYALRISRTTRPTPEGFWRAMIMAELIKVALTAGLFTAVFVWASPEPLPLFLAYIATMVVYWFALRKA
jgi:F0F1-type ATP synthase assembly protein I